ncbi:putative methyltransferase-domain-containing protein [Massariosphaeria phaeospora]|uniref:Putative methyltransferase-domain-containing protein n=1 Tax=Massariosphaeria phaeospora TaxID=100035 RepID=A0A7C8MEZ7_9PLEO|nr:putative methyltransferase-domain-containing protein [Massariosphaeria phaeospora]
MEIDPGTQSQLATLQRQYFQLVDPSKFKWPNDETIKIPTVQAWLFDNLFDLEKIQSPPPERYQLRVLKVLIARLERSINDPEEDEISDDLMSALSSLWGSNVPSESTSAQQKAFVTYTYPLRHNEGLIADDYAVTLLESRSVISASGTTGLRTWEAALLLGAYLVSENGRNLVHGKRLFELGAGTGILSVLCAKHLGVSGIVASDGDEAVVDAIKTNIFLNGLDLDDSSGTIVRAAALKWGRPIDASTFAEDYGMEAPDILLGADVTYDRFVIPALVSSMREFFDLNSALQVLVCATIRNEQTFEAFCHACKRNGFRLELLDFPPVPEHLQDGPFYPTSTPIQIWRITRSLPAQNPFSY